MNIKLKLLAGLALATFVIGCGNTSAGMKKDSEQNGEKVSASAENAAEGAKEAGKDIGAATMLTPKIKLAITSSTQLNDPKNLIDVNSTPEVVTLEGHVTSQELKDLAEEVAKKAISADGQTQKVENKLLIQP